MMTIEALVGALDLESTGTDRYRAAHVTDAPGAVVFGGQLMAQSVIAGLQGHDAMAVKTLHIVFARAARPDQPIEIRVDRMHAGRSFASNTVTISQGERLCTRAIVLLTADEPDFIRHAEPAPPRTDPDQATATGESGAAWQVRLVGGVDINDPDAIGPAELDVWTRFEGAPDDSAVSQALLAFATDGFCIATAMRPHPGVGQALAHRSISTGVISHTITFHEPFSAADWMLLAHRSPYSGHGRAYGRADVFDADGRMLASFVQDSMIRPMGEATGQL